jgi:hypothetical protein
MIAFVRRFSFQSVKCVSYSYTRKLGVHMHVCMYESLNVLDFTYVYIRNGQSACHI